MPYEEIDRYFFYKLFNKGAFQCKEEGKDQESNKSVEFINFMPLICLFCCSRIFRPTLYLTINSE